MGFLGRKAAGPTFGHSRQAHRHSNHLSAQQVRRPHHQSRHRPPRCQLLQPVAPPPRPFDQHPSAMSRNVPLSAVDPWPDPSAALPNPRPVLRCPNRPSLASGRPSLAAVPFSSFPVALAAEMTGSPVTVLANHATHLQPLDPRLASRRQAHHALPYALIRRRDHRLISVRSRSDVGHSPASCGCFWL
jgi:hypothetical protein